MIVMRCDSSRVPFGHINVFPLTVDPTDPPALAWGFRWDGEATGRLPIVVDVENASGREYSGSYSLALAPV